MANVYVLTAGQYSDMDIVGVFSTREKAEAFVAKAGSDWRDFNDVREYTVDDQVEWERGATWQRHIGLASGELGWHQEGAVRVRHPSRCTKYIEGGFGFVVSPVSQEHADKVAVEMRQEWLRTRPAATA